MPRLTPDDERVFGTADLDEGLRARSISGAALTLGGQSVKFGIHFFAVAVLGRWLAPADFGLVAMVTALTGLIALLKDFGLPAATVQRQSLTHEQVSTVFWLNAGVSLAVAALTAAVAPLVAWFYGEPRLSGITAVLGVGFLMSGLAAQHQALLRRRMRFGSLAGIEIAAQALATTSAIGAALAGAGYWSLVVPLLVLPATTLIASWIASGWRPGRPVRGSGVRPMLRFGGELTGFSVVNYFARNMDDVLIGWFWGKGALGQYNRAYSLLLLPMRQINEPVSAVALPALSRLQDEPRRFAGYYLRATNAIAWLTMPLVALLAVLSEEVVRIVLGPQWGEAAILFRVLALAAIVQPVSYTGGWVYVALGRTDRLIRWGSTFAGLYVVSFLIGLPWGPMGVATSYTIAVWVLLYPSLWAAYRGSPIALPAALAATARPAAVAAIAAAVACGVRYALAPAAPWLIVIAAVAAVGLVLLVLLAVWRGLREEWLRMAALLREVRGAG